MRARSILLRSNVWNVRSLWPKRIKLQPNRFCFFYSLSFYFDMLYMLVFHTAGISLLVQKRHYVVFYQTILISSKLLWILCTPSNWWFIQFHLNNFIHGYSLMFVPFLVYEGLIIVPYHFESVFNCSYTLKNIDSNKKSSSRREKACFSHWELEPLKIKKKLKNGEGIIM